MTGGVDTCVIVRVCVCVHACKLLGRKYMKGFGRNKPEILLDKLSGEDYL